MVAKEPHPDRADAGVVLVRPIVGEYLAMYGRSMPLDSTPPNTGRSYRIGEIARLSHLSLRTLRYWEEVGLLTPARRTDGGFRLYSDADLDRVMLVRAMKPVEFSIEELTELIRVVDLVRVSPPDDPQRPEHVQALERFVARIRSRCEIVRNRVTAAEMAALDLESLLDGD